MLEIYFLELKLFCENKLIKFIKDIICVISVLYKDSYTYKR